VFIFQSLITYFLLRLFFIKNNYQLVGYATLTLLIFGGYLFFLQYDVFACFLLVAESVVMLFILSILMHLNYTNIRDTSVGTLVLVSSSSVLCCSGGINQHRYTY